MVVQNMERMFIASTLVLSSLILAGCGINNSTVVDAAKTFTQAEISGDAKTLNQIDHSGPLEYPAQYVLDNASKAGYPKHKLSEFTFEQVGDDTVKVSGPKDINPPTLKFVKENNKYYFIGYDNTSATSPSGQQSKVGKTQIINYRDINDFPKQQIPVTNYFICFTSPQFPDFGYDFYEYNIVIPIKTYEVDVSKMSKDEIADLKTKYGISSIPAAFRVYEGENTKIDIKKIEANVIPVDI